MARYLYALLVGFAFLAGCGEPKPLPPPPTPSLGDAKTTLGQVAQDGRVGSGVLALKGSFEDLKKTDPAKGDALLKDLDELLRIGTTARGTGSMAVKEKARQMLGKL